MNRNHFYPIIQAMIAALLFGASAPLAKLLLGEIKPIPLAAFLYLGSGIGLLGIKILQNFSKGLGKSEAHLKRTDIGWLVGAILAEGVATTLIAALIFKEFISRNAWWAITLITLSSIFLSLNFDESWGLSLGALGIIAACILWGVDNNFTRNISAKDPFMIVTIKGLVAGSFSLGLAIILGNKFPAWGVILGALVLGIFSYGVSIVLFIRAMRGLGAARTSALFSTAPLAGMLLSFLLFRESLNWMFLIAVPLMIIGTVLLVNEKHEHYHIHEMTLHDHSHVHNDGHHNHYHENELNGSHSHIHEHDEVIHEHHHLPDIHHRHKHPSE
jgi:drug/metabolite transporter (DMT)-like permease